MTLFYQDDRVTLYNGDCREDTAWLTADVLITDPPYGMSYKSGYRDDKRVAGDGDVSVRDDMLAMWGPDKPAIVFGTWRAPRPAGTKSVGVWDKTDAMGPGMGDLTLPFGSSHEEFYVLGKWSDRAGKRRGSVIRTSTMMGGSAGVVAESGHPTAKPVSLMELILMAVPEGWTVADPFAGGGSTLIAARNLGLNAIGVELDVDYCRVIESRLAQGVLI